MKTHLFVCSNIDWDADEDDFVNLPSAITVGMPVGSFMSEDEDPQLFDLQDQLADILTDHTGFMVKGFSFQLINTIDTELTDIEISELADKYERY